MHGTTAPQHRLQELREGRGMRLSEVAGAIRVDQSTVYRWEHGSEIPDARKADLALLFGVTRAYLMGWEDDQPAKVAA